jgi:hypothetical protein
MLLQKQKKSQNVQERSFTASLEFLVSSSLDFLISMANQLCSTELRRWIVQQCQGLSVYG